MSANSYRRSFRINDGKTRLSVISEQDNLYRKANVNVFVGAGDAVGATLWLTPDEARQMAVMLVDAAEAGEDALATAGTAA